MQAQPEPRPLTFAEVYGQYADRVYRFTLGMVRDPALAEDLTADTFVAAMRAYEATNPDRDGLHLWLFRIAKNIVLSHKRRHRRLERVMERLGRISRRDPTVEEQAELGAEIREVVVAMSELAQRDRLVVSMRIAGLSHAEISTLLGMTEKAAGMASLRAFERLRRRAHADA